MKDKTSGIQTLLVVMVFIFIVFVFFASLGKLNSMGIPNSKEFGEDKEAAILRHKILTEKIAKKKALKAKLDEKCGGDGYIGVTMPPLSEYLCHCKRRCNVS